MREGVQREERRSGERGRLGNPVQRKPDQRRPADE
jgi:hypothetical protein